MKMIPMFVESENGHETVEVPQDQVAGVVKKQLIDGKWVSVEFDGGEEKKSELLTKDDLPKDDPVENQKWAEKFENVESITSTKTVKGG